MSVISVTEDRQLISSNQFCPLDRSCATGLIRLHLGCGVFLKLTSGVKANATTVMMAVRAGDPSESLKVTDGSTCRRRCASNEMLPIVLFQSQCRTPVTTQLQLPAYDTLQFYDLFVQITARESDTHGLPFALPLCLLLFY